MGSGLLLSMLGKVCFLASFGVHVFVVRSPGGATEMGGSPGWAPLGGLLAPTRKRGVPRRGRAGVSASGSAPQRGLLVPQQELKR